MGIGILSAQQVLGLNPSGTAAHRISRPSGLPLDALLKKSSSAIDLPLGNKYWVMKGSCRTGGGRKVKVSDLTRLFAQGSSAKTLEKDTILQKGSVHIFEVDCRLDLSGAQIEGKATAKSSIGRLDVLVRLLSDDTSEFDRINRDHDKPLYVEVTPITFDLVVRPGTCLSQLRLFRGSDRLVSMTQEEFEYEEHFPVAGEDRRFSSDDPHEVGYPFGLDLAPVEGGFSGFVTKQDIKDAIDPDKKSEYEPRDFWDPVPAKDDAIELQPDRLYILRSKERLRLPGHIALECQAYTETMGEWRIEYAGFAHPFFGFSRPEGSPLMFEVRGHNIPTILTDGIQLGKVCFKRMSQPAQEEEGQYEKQELKLSGCFKEWTK